MTVSLAALVVGLLAPLLLPSLPPAGIPPLLTAMALLSGLTLGGPWRALCLCGLGSLTTCLAAQDALETRLPLAVDRSEARFTAVVDDLPTRTADGVRLSLAVTDPVLRMRRVLLRWRDDRPGPAPGAGDCLVLTARLRTPYGIANPGGFDREAWLLRRGYGATGSALSAATSLRCAPGFRAGFGGRLASLRAAWYARVTARLGVAAGHCTLGAERLAPAAAAAPACMHAAALIRVLLTGVRMALPSSLRDLLNGTGTAHLLAVSGMHLGAVAVLGRTAGAVLAGPLALVWPALAARVPALVSLALAGGYAAVTGLGTATQRALVMAALLQIGGLLGRRVASPLRCLWAAAIVLALQPLAGLDVGFWFSFAAVIALLSFAGDASGPIRLAALQASLLVVLAPLQALFSGSVPLAGLLANPIAVPVTALVVLPLAIAAALAGALAPVLVGAQALEALAFTAATGLLAGLLQCLSGIGTLPSPPVRVAGLLLPALLALAAAALLFRDHRRLVALAVLAAALVTAAAAPPSGVVHWRVVDVGQGLAVLVRTRSQLLLVDAGGAWGDYSMGSAALLPTLRRLGWGLPDTVVISHGDTDHLGGFAALLDAYPKSTGPRVFSSVAAGAWPPALAAALAEHGIGPRPCEPRAHWRRDQVDFRFLEVPGRRGAVLRGRSGNARSCVLLVRTEAWRLLLPGDIDARTEFLLRPVLEPVDVLLAPHHGSATSSSRYFIDAVKPELVIHSAGFNSRFGHPHPRVVARYARNGSRQLMTALEGALSGRSDSPRVVGFRRGNPRWWRHHPGPGS